MGALLGADEFGFGTIAMIAEGCIMARICHTNSCPVGVTTQREALRKKFVGTPDNVLDFFHFVAQAHDDNRTHANNNDRPMTTTGDQ